MTAPLPEPQAGASARPWRVGSSSTGYDLFNEVGLWIGSVHRPVGGSPYGTYPIAAECEANAALIVQAVNCHDPLVAALTVCMEAIDYAHADPEAGLPSPSWHWWKAAREALAAAREGHTDG